MKNLIIILPIYKSHPNWNERLSFTQCLKVLNKRMISVCTYEGLDISYYIQKLDAAQISYSVDFFDKKYFRDTNGYNQLHLCVDFYRHYQSYKYMLVYQLDAYIFKDGLDEWIAKDYDYVGAPWVDEDGRLKGVGNGGFCLKKISWWKSELQWQLPVWDSKEILKRYPITDVRSFFSFIGRCFGYKNTIQSFYKDRRILYNEDGVPLLIASTSWRHKPLLPCAEDALQFSFECQPTKMYELNQKRLPMGCHAWGRYEYKTFWKLYIR